MLVGQKVIPGRAGLQTHFCIVTATLPEATGRVYVCAISVTKSFSIILVPSPNIL